jgi:lipoprotein-releasing system permease protein
LYFIEFYDGLNDLLDGLVLTAHRTYVYNEIKPNKNQPVNLASEYDGHYNFIQSIKSGNSRQKFNSGAIIQTLAKTTVY